MIKFLKKVLNSIKDHLIEVSKRLDDIRNRGLGPKS